MKTKVPQQPRHAATALDWVWAKMSDFPADPVCGEPIINEPFSEAVKLWSTMDVLTAFVEATKQDTRTSALHDDSMPDSGPYVPTEMSLLRDEVIPGLIVDLARRIDRTST